MKLFMVVGVAGLIAMATALCAGEPAVSTQVQSPVREPVSASDKQPGIPQVDSADFSAKLDGRVPYALESGDIAGVVVVVVNDGKVLFENGYLYADFAAKDPMDAKTTMPFGPTSAAR